MLKKEIELLAPGGDENAIKAAIIAGANAVYCGLNKFNARNRAANITFEKLSGILRLAHNNNCKVFLTINIVIVNNEVSDLFKLLNKLVNTSIDGIILQDLGLFYLISTNFPSLEIHASTQLTTHNKGQILFLQQLKALRVNLSRELSLTEIKELTTFSHAKSILTEVFIHGSYCISFSGLCYMSSVNGGNSGNRGRCSQPCRDKYSTTAIGNDYPLNLKDNSAYFDIKDLYIAGVDSLKIEGRIKNYEYVYTVVKTYQKLLKSLYKTKSLSADDSPLYKVFNRNFSNGFLKANIGKELFIDNPRDHSIKHLQEINDYNNHLELEKDQLIFYKEKENAKALIESKLNELSIEKTPLKITFSGKFGMPLVIDINALDKSFSVLSESNLDSNAKNSLDTVSILKRFKALNNDAYYIQSLNLDSLSKNLFIPFNELTALRNKIRDLLNDSKGFIDPVPVPKLIKQNNKTIKPSLSVLLSSERAIELIENSDASFYYELPNSFANNIDKYLNLFKRNSQLLPWFPSILMGEDYEAAVQFLITIQPKLIVTNNTGIAFEAYKLGLNWIAGPYLNTSNSYCLLALKDKFNCKGSFISNELSFQQIKSITPPENFDLYFSIYHPILLMTSKACLFQQTTGCEKRTMDNTCISSCSKSTSIYNHKNNRLFIDKTKGNYNTIYNEANYLNTQIINDLPNQFTNYLIDLRDIETSTIIEIEKLELINLFDKHISGDSLATKKLHEKIRNTTYSQYTKGI